MKKRVLIRIWIILFIILVMSFSDCSFAALESDTSALSTISKYLNLIVSFLSWIWIWFAKWAWEFLTNKWVYWEIIWLDAILRRYWNVMKNLANFGLWFCFVYVIFSSLISKEDVTKSLKKKLLGFLVAWVWIQVSWFVTAAIVDLSTITLVAVSSFPSQIISENNSVQDSFSVTLKDYMDPQLVSVTTGVFYSLVPKDAKASNFIQVRKFNVDEPITREAFFDELMPSADDVSGPLYYLWFSILKVTKLISTDNSSVNWWKATILNTLLQWWTTIIYSIEMLILFIFAIIRMLYIWMFIPLSPVVVLLWSMNKFLDIKWGKDGWFLKGFNEQVNFKSFFWNVFRPSIIVLWFWLAMIFVSLMSNVIDATVGREIDFGDLKAVSTKESTSNTAGDEGEQTYVTTVDGGILHVSIRSAWKTLMETVLSILTVILVYLIIKAAVMIWTWETKDFASKALWSLQNTAQKGIGIAPLVPVVWYDNKGEKTTHYVSAGRIIGKNWLLDRDWLLGEWWYTKVTKRVQDVGDEQTKTVMSALWWWTWLLPWDWDYFKRVWSKWFGLGWLSNIKWAIAEKKKWIDSKNWASLDFNSNKEWKQLFEWWLSEVKAQDIKQWDNKYWDVWQKMVDEWKKWGQKIEDLFNKIPGAATAYADFFGYGWKYADNYSSIEKLDISKNMNVSEEK